MQLSTFIGIARKNTKGIMFRNNTQAETVNYYLRDGLINDNLLYFTDSTEGFEEAYHGEHDSELDFATESFDECMDVPEHLANYIDYEKYANDLFMDGYYSVAVNGNGGRCVYVFSDC